jgi:hypothetical protein
MTAVEVIGAPEEPERDRAIHDWCRSVWTAFSANRDIAADLPERHGII